MVVGAALMEDLAIDKRFGFFVNHDLAGYEVPVHADIPTQDVIFLDEVDPTTSPMKAKGVGELGICGVAAAVANAIYHATRSEEHTSELQSLMRISYAVFCLTKKIQYNITAPINIHKPLSTHI